MLQWTKLILLLLLWPALSLAIPQTYWIQTPHTTLEVNQYQPKGPVDSTVVLLNGLTYEKESWQRLIQELLTHNFEVITYDPLGQGYSLRQFGAPRLSVPIEQQADDLFWLAQALSLKKMNLIGLSYGGGLAIAFAEKYGHLIDNAFLLAPYTEPLESQDRSIQQQIQWIRLTQPWNTQSDDELYAALLRINVFQVFPLAEANILNHPEKREAVFQLIQGIRKFNMNKASQNFPANSVHLVIAGLDQYIPRAVLERFWSQLPAASRSTKMVIRFSEHKLPEAAPQFTAIWIKQVVMDKKNWQNRTSIEDTLYDNVIDHRTIFRSSP